MKILVAIAASSILLSGCASQIDVTGWTPEQIEALQADNARREANMAAMGQALRSTGESLGQSMSGVAGAYSAAAGSINTQVDPYGQPNGAAIVYCRDLTGSIIACKQIR